MDTPRWDRVKAVFQEAFERGGAERAAYLETACAGDSDLRADVERLLGAHASSLDFLEASPALGTDAQRLAGAGTDDSDTPAPPGQIGPYRVLRELGRGGMGTVYLAERDEPGLRKTVAIKVVRHGMGSEYVLRRFETERQILAALEHDGIARLYDGGTTESGLPYFVMEYVLGQDLLAYCDAHSLTIAARVRLFRRVCEAVQYAHQNLVVHRDLKPSNILVTAEGEPKLLDFGIAKVVTPQQEGERVEATATLFRLLTPEYASPEQVRGERVTTSSDVYSLGVVLYELLSGHRPYRVKSRHAAEIERAVFEQEPEPPSACAGRSETLKARAGREATTLSAQDVSRKRDTVPGALRRQLRGDLDNIVLKALRKEPAARYATAAELADDLGRFLESRPVLAQPDRWTYRTAKFVRRHRAAVVAAAAIVCSVLSGLGLALWQAHVARAERALAQRRFEEARRLIATVIFDIQPKLAGVAGATPMRKTLIDNTLEYLEALAQDAGDNPALLRDLVRSYVELARVQGDATSANLGDPKTAHATLERAEALVKRLMIVDPNGESLSQAALVEQQLAGSYAVRGLKREGEAHARRAVEYAERRVTLTPKDPRARVELGDAWFALSVATLSVEDLDRSRVLYEEALRENPDNPVVQRSLALTYKSMAARDLYARQPQKCLALMAKAREIDERRLAAFPEDPRAQMDVALDLSQIASAYHNLGDHQKAVAMLQESIAMREKILSRNPDDARVLDRLAWAVAELGQYRLDAHDESAAALDLERAVRMFAELRARGVAHQQLYAQAGTAELSLGRIEAGRGSPGVACEHYRRAARAFDDMPAGAVFLTDHYRKMADNARQAAAGCDPPRSAGS